MKEINLIALSGKMKVGKNLVCDIIQYLTDYNKAFYSYPTTEKDLKEYIKNGHKRISEWEQKSFAGKLKQIASLLTGIDIENFDDQEFKKTFLEEEWNYIKEIPLIGFDNNIIGSDSELIKMTVRELLQKIGTECFRDNLHENTWVNALFADRKPLDYISIPNNDSLHGESYTKIIYPKWIITDCRFPNEYNAVKERGGIVIRINRDIRIYDGKSISFTELSKLVSNPEQYKKYENNHLSETSLDKFEFDEVIDNNGTIDELIEKVKQIMIKYKII